jgi:hypothetical protein
MQTWRKIFDEQRKSSVQVEFSSGSLVLIRPGGRPPRLVTPCLLARRHWSRPTYCRKPLRNSAPIGATSESKCSMWVDSPSRKWLWRANWICVGAFFEPAPGIRRTPLFRFSLMVIRPDDDPVLRRTSTTWSALKGQPLVSLVPSSVVQKFIDKHLIRAEVFIPRRAVFNYLDTMIAMVEAGEGIAVIPSFVLPACRNRKVVMSKLTNPVVNVDFSRISLRGKKLPPGADDFTSFLQSYIARWAGRAGIL